MSTTEEQPPVHAEDDDVFEEGEQADDWEDQPLARRPRRRLLTPLTALLFAILVGAGGFIVGVQVEKGEVSSSSSGGGGRLASLLGSAATGATGRSGTGGASGGAGEGAAGGGSRFGGNAGAAAGGGFGGGGAGATVGQVANISGSDLYVTELQGNTVKVAASAAQITKQVSTSVKGIHPGDTVVVAGTHLPSGSIQATTVRDSGSTGAGAGLALFGGSGAASTSGSGGSSGGNGSSSGSGKELHVSHSYSLSQATPHRSLGDGACLSRPGGLRLLGQLVVHLHHQRGQHLDDRLRDVSGSAIGKVRGDAGMPAEGRHHAAHPSPGSAADARRRRIPRRWRRRSAAAQGCHSRAVRSGTEEVRRRTRLCTARRGALQ
jgi:hypothetical protein